LRRLCGWERPAELCSEATFSRAFAEFARSELPSRLHEALIKRTHEDRLVGHISRDATAIEAREKPVKTAAAEASASAQPPKRKRGRPRKDEVVEKKEPRRLERQADMSLAEMLSDLPARSRKNCPHCQNQACRVLFISCNVSNTPRPKVLQEARSSAASRAIGIQSTSGGLAMELQSEALHPACAAAENPPITHCHESTTNPMIRKRRC
jgi:hypothetical protein